jgi:hypothetical protein
VQDPKYPFVPNETGQQPTYRIADLSNWLELLSEIAPGLMRAAIMFNPDTSLACSGRGARGVRESPYSPRFRFGGKCYKKLVPGEPTLRPVPDLAGKRLELLREVVGVVGPVPIACER